MFREILSKWKKDREPKEESQPGLFEWAESKETGGVITPEPEERKKRALFFAIIALGGAGAGFLLACLLCQGGGVALEKEGEIVRKNGERIAGVIVEMGEGRLVLRPNEEGREPLELPLDSLERIVFVEKEDPEASEQTGEAGASAVRELTQAEKQFLGRYRIEVSGHSGILSFYRLRSGYLGGAVRFSTWGNHSIEYLKRVYVQGNRIHFQRSCGGTECRRIGAGGPFRQIYSGELSPDRARIDGNYQGGQNASRWKALRM